MNKFFNKIKSADGIGIIFLAILVVVAGYMVYFQKDFKVTTSTKSNSNHQDLAGYYFDDYYDDYYDDDYYYDEDDRYYYEDDEDYYYDDDDDYYYDDDDYNDDYYYVGNNYYDYDDYYNEDNYYDYGDTKVPSIKYKSSRILKQYSIYDPMDEVSAYHTRFGDVTDIIEIVYNDVDTDIPGVYTTVYKACNYPGSIYCVTVSTDVTVRDEYHDIYDKSNRGPIWSDTDSVSCTENSTKCSTYNITEPTAKDPVTNRKLNVTLVEGSVNIYEPGTYVLVYSAETRSGVVGTTSKIVKITERNNSSSNNSSSSSSNKATRKYISNYKSDYYDDGYYRGYLEEDYSNGYGSKYIDNYEWTNKVTYTYKCTNVGEYGTTGWSLVSTDKSNGKNDNNADNHPTYYYNKNGYSGTLTKSGFYLKDSETKLAQDLGKCTTNGQTKQVTRTWVGEYSGTVYSNYNYKTTYSGYVYLYR